MTGICLLCGPVTVVWEVGCLVTLPMFVRMKNACYKPLDMVVIVSTIPASSMSSGFFMKILTVCTVLALFRPRHV